MLLDQKTIEFADLGLAPGLLLAVKAKNYLTPTPIQAQAIPLVLAGKDLIGSAQTGTGKTAAFALPILHRLLGAPRPARGHRDPRVLVLTPTRELAIQIDGSFRDYGSNSGLRHAVIYGGVSQGPQEQALRQGVDILVATPGRLLDLMSQRLVNVRSVEIFVLDEADRMLDMGFIHDIRRVIAELPVRRQTLFFSATMPLDIKRLADAILRDPVLVAVSPVASPAENVEHVVHFVEKADKRALLQHLLEQGTIRNALVFSRTRHGAERITQHLNRAGIRAEAIHGDKSQKAREKALDNFKRGKTQALVATDVAARGIDIIGLSHVINFDVPNEPEAYVHRIGRTGRAGASGIALSFCDATERSLLADIERLIQKRLAVAEEHPFRSALPPPRPTNLDPGRPKGPQSPFLINADKLYQTKAEAQAPKRPREWGKPLKRVNRYSGARG